MPTLDPVIIAVFGEPPAGTSLTESTTTLYTIVSCVVFGLAVAAVGLRFCVRTMNNTNNLGLDDVTMIVALVSTAALVSTTIIAGQYGSGQHIWANNIDELMALLQVVYAEPWVYGASVSSTKVSILLLYKRLFLSMENTNRVFTTMFWVAASLVCVYPIILWIVMAVACRPVSFFWRQYQGATDGMCIEVLWFFLIFGIINMLVDAFILIVPIPLIMRLQMNTRKKVSVCGIMLLGSFVCVASIFRIHYLAILKDSVDVSWNLGPAFAWSSLEPSIAMISACLPTYAPLFRSLKNKDSASSGRGSTNYLGRSGAGVGNQSTIGASATYKNKQIPPYMRFDEDEVELTRIAHGSMTETDSVSRTSSDHKMGGIAVKQHYTVTHEKRI